MAVNQPTGYNRTTNEALDALYLHSGSVYTSSAQVNAAVNVGIRYTGSFFNVNGQLWWYYNDTTDASLQPFGNSVVPIGVAITGSNTFSGSQVIEGDVYIYGALKASTYIISSSVVNYTESFYSGSTNFGDTIDDVHTFTGSVYVSGNMAVIGQGTFTGITSSLYGTASWANYALLAPGYVTTQSYLIDSASFYSKTLNIYASESNYLPTASYLTDSSSFNSRINTIIATYATTGSNNFVGNQVITGSLTVAGDLYAQTLHVLVVTASTEYSSGSNIFGNSLLNTQSFTGSSQFTGSVSIYGSESLSGALQLKPSQDPNPIGDNLTDTYLFVSSSNTSLGNDLYIRQDGNLVKWKWMQGHLGSGLLYGGGLSYSGSQLYIQSGSGIIVNYNATTGSEINPTAKYVSWPAITQSALYITSSQATWVYIDSNGNLNQQTSFFTPNQYDDAIPLGVFNHPNRLNITSIGNDVYAGYGTSNQSFDFIQAFGPIKVSGLTISGQTGTLRLNVAAGTSYILGGFYQQDPKNVSTKDTLAYVTASLSRVYRSGSTFITDNNAGAFYTTIDPTHYDNGTGTLATTGTNNWTIQRVFFNPFSGNVQVYYGQTLYTSKDTAVANLAADSFTEALYTSHQHVFVGYLIVKGGTTDLTSTTDNIITQAGLFRNTVGSSGASVFSNALSQLSDVSLSSPVTGQALVYNGGSWTNGIPASASYSLNSTSASYAAVALNAPNYTPTSSFQTYTASINTQLTNIYVSESNYLPTASYLIDSASFNTRINNNTAGLVLFSNFTSSYNTGSFTGTFVGTASYALTASYSPNYLPISVTASMLSVYILASQTSSMSVLNAQTASYVLGSNVSGPVANATSASYAVSSSLASTASYVLASNVVGLNLSQISTGSVTASVSTNGTVFSVVSGSTKVFSVSSSGMINAVNGVQVSSSLQTFYTIPSSAAGNNNLITAGTGSFTSLFCQYTVASGSNARAGKFFAVWNGTAVSYTDASTADIGNTSTVSMSLSISAGSAILSVYTPASGWNLKTTTTFM